MCKNNSEKSSRKLFLLVGVPQTVPFVNRAFVPCQKEGVLTKTVKMTNLRSNQSSKGFAAQTRENVTGAKAWFTKGMVFSFPELGWMFLGVGFVPLKREETGWDASSPSPSLPALVDPRLPSFPRALAASHCNRNEPA